GAGVPERHVPDHRPSGRAGAAAGQATQRWGVQVQAVGGRRGGRKGGEPGGGGGQTGARGRFVQRVHPRAAGDAGAPADQVQEGGHPIGSGVGGGGAVELEDIPVDVGVDSDRGGGGERVQGQGQAAGNREDQLLVALAPVLHQCEVRERAGSSGS